MRGKYRNRKTNGYDSKREANRAAELHALKRAGVIDDLVEQPEFVLIPKQAGERAVKYRADFQYFDKEQKKLIVEDVKGFRTRDYILKRKLFLFRFGFPITEVQ